MRAGEICHYQGSCVFQRVRYVQSGPRLDEYHGAAAITDTRFAFTAAEKAWAIPHRRVLQLNDIHHGVHLQTGKGSGSYYFGPDHKTATLIYRTAVAKANRKIVGDPGGLPSRHIPGDVRDRVWQEYSGRCAECKADQYLEFDHIIPVAKGGNNTQANIQLLCRRCNLTKSDSI
jgi:hypothetical protein